MHGFALIFNQSMKRFSNFNINKIFSIFLTFNYVNLAFVFFRAENLEAAFNIISTMFFLNGIETKVYFEISRMSISAFFLAFIICFALKNTNYYLAKFRN